MNKVYKYIYDYRLPTERPFKEAVREYWQRVLIIGAVSLSAMVASVLIALIIITFQAGYGAIVIIVIILILLGGTSGGTSGGGQTPPTPPNTSATKQQPEERQATQTDAEKVLVLAPRSSPPKQKMLALRTDDPTKPPIEIEIDKNNRKG